MNKEQIMEKIDSLFDLCRVFYLATVDSEGKPEIRAIENLRCKGSFPELAGKFTAGEKCFDIFMATGNSSAKCRAMEKTRSAAVYLHQAPEFFGVTLHCGVEFLDDAESRKKYWANKFRYFWKGTNDPEYRLMKLVPSSVEGWTGQHLFSYDL